MMYRILLVLFVSTIFIPAAEAQWVSTGGPAGGTIAALTTLGNDVYAGTPQGLYRSTDEGQSWTPLTISSQAEAVQSLAVLDSDIFVLTPDALIRSTNNGLSWRELDLGFVPYDGTITAAGQELFLSSEYGGVYRSSNRGATWDTIVSLTDTGATCFVEQNGTFFAGTDGYGIFQSTDSGQTWSSAPDIGLPTTIPFGSVSSLAVSNNQLFAATDTAVFASSDAGSTWQEVIIPNFLGFDVELFAFGSDLFVSSYEGFYVSTDGGNSWSTSATIPTETFVGTMAAIGQTVLAGASTGIYLSTDNGSDWSIDNGFITTDISGLAATGNALLATSSGSLFKTDVHDSSWTNITSNLGTFSQITAIAASNSEVFAATNSPSVSVSFDTGSTWNNSSTSGAGEITINCLCVTPNTVLAGTSAGIFLSSDGIDWTNASSGLSVFDIGVLSIIQGQNSFYCGSAGGGVYNATANADLWTNIAPIGSTDSILALAESNGNLFAGGIDGVVTSTDNGTDWSDAQLSSVAALEAVGPNVFAGTSTGVELSIDGGLTWNSVSQGLPNLPITSLTIADGNLYAGTVGAGVWMRPLSQMINFSSVEKSMTENSQPQNYPNPFFTQTTIPFTLSQAGHVTITIFDLLGHPVATLASADYAAGSHSVVWNPASVPAGVFRCQIDSPDGVLLLSLAFEGGN